MVHIILVGLYVHFHSLTQCYIRAKQEERCVANEKALADRKKALESRKIIFNHAKQYAREYKA